MKHSKKVQLNVKIDYSFRVSIAQVTFYWNENQKKTFLCIISIPFTSDILPWISYRELEQVYQTREIVFYWGSQIRAQQQAVQSSDAGNNLHVPRLKRSAMNTFVFFIA